MAVRTSEEKYNKRAMLEKYRAEFLRTYANGLESPPKVTITMNEDIYSTDFIIACSVRHIIASTDLSPEMLQQVLRSINLQIEAFIKEEFSLFTSMVID